MSSSRALCCLPSVKKQKHFFFVQCIIKLGYLKDSNAAAHSVDSDIF